MKMIYKSRMQIIPFALLLFLVLSCKDDMMDEDSITNDSSSTSTVDVVEGIVRIKLEDTQTSSLSVSLKSGTLSTNISNIDSVLTSIGATSFERTFPYAGKFEARTIEAGLHLWYDVKYDTTVVDISSALSEFKQLSEIDVTEPIRTIKTLSIGDHVTLSRSLKSTSSDDYMVDDPYLWYQWHYYNDGSVTNAIEGCDINLFDAWLKQTGSSDVIVAIVDGGIDIDHADLADNIWINEAEYNGATGVDDDDNGYTDDIYGYNFVDNSGTIDAHFHGSHVAGTVGAVNNNGIGLCGVAGGNSEGSGSEELAEGDGVQLMSCQVFQEDENGDDESAEDFAAAIKYGADNGAVISQNSWGYTGATELPIAMQDAIDYFIEYAGFDENGDQTGPMAGGILIFAAGNDSVSINAYPAMYDEVVAVAACDPDYTMSYYSNYGTWIDIVAPGGTTYDSYDVTDYDSWIVSTSNVGSYGFSIGTSMACPHVSGVAALILSEYGGDGYTPEMLKERLYYGVIDLDDYNPGYEGMLGAGLINAAGTLSDYDSEAPEEVNDLAASVAGNNITLTWTVTSDADDIKPTGYKIYYSSESFTADDITDDDSSISTEVALVGLNNVGDEMELTMSNLNYSTTYYFKIVGYDVLGTYSDYSSTITALTESNSSPIITSDEGNYFELEGYETSYFTCSISDPDGDSFFWSLTDNSGNITIEDNGDELEITINALLYDAGSYEATITVDDAFGASTDFEFDYTILENNAPVVITAIDDVYIGDSSNTYSIDLSNYIEDEDGEDLDYELSYSSSYVTASVSNDILTITPESYGLSTFSITASDAKEETASISFEIMVRDDSSDIDIYPNPVTDVVNIRMGEDIDGELTIKFYNDNAVLVNEVSTTISTFSPASTDISTMSSGQYLLKITYDEQEFEENIIKL